MCATEVWYWIITIRLHFDDKGGNRGTSRSDINELQAQDFTIDLVASDLTLIEYSWNA